MSVEALSLALHHSRAKGSDKLVLIGIANHDGDGGAWPSLETLSKYANCSVTRVKQAIKTLVELGEITVQLHAGGDQNTRNDRRPNLYRVVLTCPPECDGSKKHRTTVTPSDCRQEIHDSQKCDPRQAEMTLTGVTPSTSEPSTRTVQTRTKDASTSSNVADEVAKLWWSEQNPKPAGKGAWWALLKLCRAESVAGWSNEAIYAALNRAGGTVPSLPYMDRLLRNSHANESNRDRSFRAGAERMKRNVEAERQAALSVFAPIGEVEA